MGRYLFYRQNNLEGLVELGAPGDDALLGEGWGAVEERRDREGRRTNGPARLFAPLDVPEDLGSCVTRRRAARRDVEVRVQVNGRDAGRFAADRALARAVGPGAGAAWWRRELNSVLAGRGRRCGCSSTACASCRSGECTTAPRRAVVIGGGPAGLKAAHTLAKAGLEVTLLESGPLLGGLASSIDVQGARIEKYYHFICRGDDDLVDDAAPSSASRAKLHWRDSRMAYFVDGRLYPFLTPVELLRFAPLTLAERVRAGVAVKLAQRMREEDLAPQRGDPLAAADVRRPRLPRDLGAAHALQVRRARGRDQRGLDLGAHGAPVALAARRAWREELGYVEGGSQTVLDALGPRPRGARRRVRLNAPVEQIVLAGRPRDRRARRRRDAAGGRRGLDRHHPALPRARRRPAGRVPASGWRASRPSASSACSCACASR